MSGWAQYLLASVGLVLAAPLIAWAARRFARGARGGLALGALLFGFGSAMDPPSRHAVEANDQEAKGSPETDEPKA